MQQHRSCWLYTWPWRGVRVGISASFQARCRTMCSRNTSPAELIFIRRSRPCAWSLTCLPGRTKTYPTGTRSPSPAITCARPDPRRCRKWRSRWAMAWPTWRRRSRPGSTWTSSLRGFRFSLMRTATFWKKWRMWARIMREHFKAKNPRSWMLRFHTQTAGSTLTAQQPENNIVRTAIQALAAVMGGTQSLHTNSYDEALALPTEQAARIALRTQQVIAYESGAPQTVDPLAGSYYIETLTNEIEKRAAEYLGKIEAMGGVLKAIEGGYVQQEIQNAAYEYQQTVDRHKAIVVGVNAFELDEEKPIPIQRIDPELEQKQVERVRALRAKREASPWRAALAGVEDVARSGANVMPRILAAVEARATVGEISDAMRRVFGEYKEAVVI